MLDDKNIFKQRDPKDLLGLIAREYEQASFDPQLDGRRDGSVSPIKNIVLAGMGGSALAGSIIKDWLHQELTLPFEICRGYDLPGYINKYSLVIIGSHSGNTEEMLSVFDRASQVGAQIAVVTSGGSLADRARSNGLVMAELPKGDNRTMLIATIRSILAVLDTYGVTEQNYLAEIEDLGAWLQTESSAWLADVEQDENYAKQLALKAAGKTAVFYGGSQTASLASKWKIAWNENAKNVAFRGQYPEVSHNEFAGWSSHPVDKPFAVFDLVSDFENPRILKRFEVSDRLLSGMRPKSVTINLAGETLLAKLLWGSILADFTSTYLAILNGVDPTPLEIVDKLKQAL